MSHYSLTAIVLWLATLTGNVALGICLAGKRSVVLQALRLYLWLEVAISAIGFGLVALNQHGLYYLEFLWAQGVDALAQAILLSGIWRSFHPRIIESRAIRYAALALFALMAALSARETSASIANSQLRLIFFILHLSGYLFCLTAFSIAIYAWIRACSWRPSAARIMIGYVLATGSSFGIEQTQAVLHWNAPSLMNAPSFFYLFALVLWYSAISLDKPRNVTSEEAATIERHLTEALGASTVPGRSHRD